MKKSIMIFIGIIVFIGVVIVILELKKEQDNSFIKLIDDDFINEKAILDQEPD